MRDFYVALASEAVHRDVCPIIAPDFRYTDGRIEREFVQRRARDVNLNDEIRWRVNRQIDLFVSLMLRHVGCRSMSLVQSP